MASINTKNPDIVSDILDRIRSANLYVKNDSSYHEKSNSSGNFLKISENKFFEKYLILLPRPMGIFASVWAPYEFYLG